MTSTSEFTSLLQTLLLLTLTTICVSKLRKKWNQDDSTSAAVCVVDTAEMKVAISSSPNNIAPTSEIIDQKSLLASPQHTSHGSGDLGNNPSSHRRENLTSGCDSADRAKPSPYKAALSVGNTESLKGVKGSLSLTRNRNKKSPIDFSVGNMTTQCLTVPNENETPENENASDTGSDASERGKVKGDNPNVKGNDDEYKW
eukprot:CAMPEP_0204626286 /NCGR_PEP_ID=MMETSP0717-20131115/11966_1 /ASSEMBLY_ACC=CAM_ASM_000666 /TAXON_ID=230516 /ORGANISM="Chaetoceros curvisetus" /LENGTH=199 /DNA_ID=CAMNT_0051642187 /DNA_START=301 /DNA_END=897 /DNA_ORIENTATION=-